MNNHWLKERYNGMTTEELKAELANGRTFDPFKTEYKSIEAELLRREQETVLVQEVTPND